MLIIFYHLHIPPRRAFTLRHCLLRRYYHLSTLIMKMRASAQLLIYVFFLGFILILTESMSLAASWPRTTSISPALARSAPHAARLKSPPSPPLLYANSWPLPVPFATRESTVTATPSRRAGLQDLSRRHHSMACKPPLQAPTTPRRHANPAAMSTQHGAQVPPRRKLQTKTTEATVEAAIQRRRQQRGDDRNRDGTTPCNHNGATMSATTATQGDEQHRRR